MKNFIGIDGCKGGWLVVAWDGQEFSHPVITFIPHIEQLDLETAYIVAIDIPIGFKDVVVKGGRDAEREARCFIPGKKSSIFSAPCRKALETRNFVEASTINRENSESGKIGLSQQSAALIQKMREVDLFVTPEIQDQLFESHPEVSFAIMNDKSPVLSKKRHKAGQAERKELLRCNGFPVDHLVLPSNFPRRWSNDDILDSCACAWSARRIYVGKSERFPSTTPPKDKRGLRMVINA